MVKKATNGIEYFIGRNYCIVILKDEENEGYAAHHPELRGCVTCGGDIHSVIENLNQAKKAWITAALEIGYPVPEPNSNEFFIQYRGYMGNIKYSDEDKIYYGKIIGLKKGLISYEGDTITSLAVDFVNAVDEHIEL